MSKQGSRKKNIRLVDDTLIVNTYVILLLVKVVYKINL